MIFFFVPYGLITAELGSTYPDQGGIYAWVRRAYGARWGGRVAWLWWINVALWQPSVFILFAGIFAALFMPDLALWTQIAIAVALTWLTVWINVVRLDIGKWVPNLGAVFKVAIMLVIGIGGFVYASNHGVANELTLSSMAPSWGVTLAFLPVIVYNFMGFELMSGASAEMKNPARDVPLTIAVSGILIAAFYLFATIGILIALPLDDINLVSGIVDAARIAGRRRNGRHARHPAGPDGALFFVANMATGRWCQRSAAEAALDGNLPSMFARLHPEHKTPANAAIVTGVVTTVVIVIYGLLAADAEDLFWTLFAFSSIVFLLPYLSMFMAFLKLRRIDPERPRPYRVPGGSCVALALAALCIVFIVQAIVFFIYTPEEFDMTYAASIVTGVAITVLIGEVLVRRAGRVAGR